MNNGKFLVVVVNGSEALLFDASELRTKDLHLIRKVMNPDGRKKVADLVTDKPGFSQHSGGIANAYEGKHDPKAVEAERFALELVTILHSECGLQPKDRVLVVAPSHIYSLFAKHWHNHFPTLEHLAKDYTKFPVKELTETLREHLFTKS